MARAVLASELLQRLREATDSQNDTHIGDAEGYRALTSAASETWEEVMKNGLGTDFVKKAQFTSTAGTLEYDLGSDAIFSIEGAAASTVTDFFRVAKVMVLEGTNNWRPVTRVEKSEIYPYQPINASCTVRLYYYPCAPTFTSGSESFDGINGWEEHTIQTAAMQVKAKKFDDLSPYRTRKRELELRMQTMANRNGDEPPRIIQRCRTNRLVHRYAPYIATLAAWDIRQDKIELYSGSYR